METLLILLVCSVQVESITTDNVAIIELNITNGYEYWLFWDWYGESHHIVDWRSKHKRDVLVKDTVLYLYENNTYRKIKSKYYRKTITSYDPEIIDRQFLPKHLRRKLTPMFPFN